MPELVFLMKFAIRWAGAFLSLGLAVVLLNIYFGLIGNDLELRTAGKEAAIAAFASFVEAVGIWLSVSVFPGAGRAMIFFIFVTGLIYKIAHFEDWNWNDAVMLMAFQVVIVLVGVSLAAGGFTAAILILGGFVLVLGLIAAFARSL